jgi:glycosyltransferase 2 family protein
MVRTLLKFAVTALLIWVALRGIDFDLFMKNMLAADRLALAAAAALIVSLTPLLALRWRDIIAAIGFRSSFGTTFPIVWIGLFFSQVLPSAVGGDAVRVWLAYKNGVTGSGAVTSVLIDRLMGVLAILLLLTVQLPALWNFPLDRPIIAGLFGLIMMGNLGLVAAASIDRAPAWIQSFTIGRYLAEFSAELRRTLLNYRRLLLPLVYSTVNQAGAVVCVAIIGLGLGLKIDLATYLIVVPLANLVQVLPISVGGWGLRESFYVLALAKLGVPGSDALALSVLYGLLTMICSLPGGIVWLMYRHDKMIGK